MVKFIRSNIIVLALKSPHVSQSEIALYFPPGDETRTSGCILPAFATMMKDRVCMWKAQHINEWIDNPVFYGIIWSTGDPTTGNSSPLWSVYTLSWEAHAFSVYGQKFPFPVLSYGQPSLNSEQPDKSGKTSCARIHTWKGMHSLCILQTSISVKLGAHAKLSGDANGCSSGGWNRYWYDTMSTLQAGSSITSGYSPSSRGWWNRT